MIPIASPVIGQEEADAASRVILSGMLASGSEVSAFENEFAEYIGTSEGVATSNGTTALYVALKALGIGQGDEVIVPSFTFIATATSVTMCGASPVIADIEAQTYGIEPESVMELISSKTKAVIGVHLFGHPCNIMGLSEICEDHSLLFLEDCAQAHGSEYRDRKVGGYGACGCFSFYPTKNMTCGEGGMITADDPELAGRIRMLINHGQKEKYLHTELGYNFRLTDIGAAIGRVQLKKLDDMNRRRQLNGEYYSETIHRNGFVTPMIRPDSTHVYHQYVIRVTEEAGISRDDLAAQLTRNGIGTAIHYPLPVHKQPLYLGRVRAADCRNATRICSEILSIPVHPNLTREQRDHVARVVKGCV